MSLRNLQTNASTAACLLIALLLGCNPPRPETAPTPLHLEISANRRYFQTSDGAPFFWLGDTGWLMFKRLNREEALQYLDDRKNKGFNVIQAMVLHGANDVNAYGASALIDEDPGQPRTTPGDDPEKEGEYDFWDHVGWIVDRAAERGIHVGMVAAWGSNARSGKLNEGNVEAFTRFLVERYGSKPNIVWITGGDTQGDRETEVWRTMGQTFRQLDPNHLITFHPFGRTQSSTWFHGEPWMDFNMFQSGHRRYDQDDTAKAFGEDNWRYVAEDLSLEPVKATLDGEPSYESIPQGLHDRSEPYWNDADVRRYAYWPVFAGAAGHTYGHNPVMQMHKPDSGKGAYGVREFWYDAIDGPGAGQMRHLKKLMLSRPYFERVPDQSLIVGESGERYERVIATRGKSYLFAYTYTGRSFRVRLGAISGSKVRACWYDPRTGVTQETGLFENQGEREFDPPGDPAPGNDWVLVIDDDSGDFEFDSSP